MNKLISLLMWLCITNAFPLFEYLNIYKNDDDIDIRCNDVEDYYTSAYIINHSILYSNNITNRISKNANIYKIEKINKLDELNKLNKSIEYKNNNELVFHGLVNLEYNTLPYCKYTCDMIVIANQKHSHFISSHFNKYFKIGGKLHLICNSTICTWGNLYCDSHIIRDEL